jgi:hypothetical protein
MIPPFYKLPIANCRMPIELIGNQQSAIANELVSTVRQHRHDAVMVRLGDEHIDIEVPLSLIGLFGQYVARMRMATLDLSGSCEPHSLGCTFMCF